MIAVVVIHDLNLALRFCDRFLLMKDGQVYRHGDRSILDSTALKEVYGVDAKVVEIEGRHMVLVEE
jgi:iron complex transport system ATP-binding protein